AHREPGEEAPRHARSPGGRQGRAPVRQHLHRRRGHSLSRWAENGAQGWRCRFHRAGDRGGLVRVIERERYVRQMLLVEIGEAGQGRLGRADARVGGEGLSHEVATAYAVRAGIARVVPGRIDEAALAPSFLEIPAARATLAGSRAALTAIRAAL